MLETMSRAAAENPDILCFGMMVQNKILICRVLVLTDSAFDQRRLRKLGKTHPEIGPRCCQAFLRNLAFHSSRINCRSPHVVGNFESAPVVPRNSVKPVLSRKSIQIPSAVVAPYRQLRIGEAQVAGSSPEAHHFLTSRRDHRREK